MEQLVTIVVPFYNVREYIGECLDSLVEQTYRNIEILCIDDCSPDDSLEIVESYATRDSRIRIVKHKENKGLGGARNTAIKHAKGNYICFVDSDDYVSQRYVELLYQAITKDNSDIAICNFWQDLDGVISPYGGNYINNHTPIKNNKSNVLETAMKFNPGCTNKFYKLELLIENDIFLPEQRYYEDVIFWLIGVYHSSKISTIGDRLYYYRQRSGSIMNSLGYKHIDDRIEFIKRIDSFVNDNILTIPNIDSHKITDEILIYILRHLNYGKKLIDEAVVENIESIDKYYNNEIVKFSVSSNWRGLPLAFRYSQQNNTLTQQARDNEIDLKKKKELLAEIIRKNNIYKSENSKRMKLIWFSFSVNILLLIIIALIYW